MKHIGLFEGIGGFSLAARWMGWKTIAWCEWNEFGQKVLRHHFPKAEGHGDIKKTDFTKYANRVDILTGGFPCQPYSTAGKRLGKDDERHLWPEMLRAVREISPRWVVGENVRGLTNWNGGMVFDEVQADLETEGYEVLPFLLPACAVNAPHRRDRIWFVAYSSGTGHKERETPKERQQHDGRRKTRSKLEPFSSLRPAPNTSGERLQKPFCRQFRSVQKTSGTQQGSEFERVYAAGDGWRGFPAQSPLRGRNDGLPAELDSITVSDWCTESIKAYGNAIVPQVAYEIFKAIQKYEVR